MMFRKFSCGCVGLVIDGDDHPAEAWCVVACDHDGYGANLGFSCRDELLNKDSEPLSRDEATELIRQISCLMLAGRQAIEAVRELKHALRSV